MGARRGSGFGLLLRRMARRAAGRNGVIAVEKARREAVEEVVKPILGEADQRLQIVLRRSCVEEGQAARSGDVSREMPPKNLVGVRIGLATGHGRASVGGARRQNP